MTIQSISDNKVTTSKICVVFAKCERALRGANVCGCFQTVAPDSFYLIDNNLINTLFCIGSLPKLNIALAINRERLTL